MGEPIKDHMDLDSVGHESMKQASPRASLQMSPRLSLQMHRDLQDDNLDDSSSIYMHPGNLAQELPPDRPPPTPQKFPPLDLSEKPQYDLGPSPAVPERRASQYNIPPPLLERRASQYDMGPPATERRASQYDIGPPAPERRASQFDLGLQPPPAAERRPSSLLDKESLYALPERSVAPHQSSFLPEAMLERLSVLHPPPQQYHPSAAPTPRLSIAGVSNFPVLRDSGAFMSSQAINEAEPYSPASGVSSSGEGGGHIDRDAMLARAYHEKQQSQVKAWERHRSTKNLNKYESEIARITAWETCQVAKAEALMKKSEEELEKKRANLIESFKNKIASVHRRADEWRALSETRRVEEILRVEEGAARFRATGNLPKKPLLHIQSLRDMCCGFTLPYNRFMYLTHE